MMSRLSAFFAVMLVLTFGLHATGVTWPIPDCHERDIDLLLVTDKPYRQVYNRQMLIQFFSSVVDIFSPPNETMLKRLRVSFLISTENESAHFQTLFGFEAYDNKTELKGTVEAVVHTNISASDQLNTLIAIEETVLNGTSRGVREDAEHIIVFVTFNFTWLNECGESSLNSIWSGRNIKLMIISPTPERIEECHRHGYVRTVWGKLSDVSTLNKASLAICNRCSDGWFRVGNVITPFHQELDSVYCYKLFQNDHSMSWMDANRECIKDASSLVSIETLAESTQIRHSLISHIQTSRGFISTPTSFIYIFIGLTRSKSTRGRRFRWVNSMPITYTQWLEGEPHGGRGIHCAIWKVSTNGTNENGLLNEELGEGWISVNCGQKMSRFYLCETFIVTDSDAYYFVRSSLPIYLNRLHVDKYTSAIERGELLNTSDGTLVSAARFLLLSNHRFIAVAFVNHNLRQKVPISTLEVYSCGYTGIPYTSVCDGVSDCSDRRDEQDCRDFGYRQFKCRDGTYIDPDFVCDLYGDCPDGSDERDCDVCQHGSCSDGLCLPKHWFGDGELDCKTCEENGSLSAEIKLVHDPNITQCVFICNRTECVYESMLGDGVIDCLGPEGPVDETIGALQSQSCYSQSENMVTRYSGWGPKCIYIKDGYDEPLGCRNMKNLVGCADFVCPEGYVKCPDSYCIPVHYIRNGEFECPHGEDEDMIIKAPPGYFRCYPERLILHPDLVCDNHKDCPKGDDEINCHLTCSPGFFCLAGVVMPYGYNKSEPLENATFIDHRTRYLDLSGISLKSVFPELINNLPDLHHFNASRCNISNLTVTDSFCSDTSERYWVVNLDLSYNVIESIERYSVFECLLFIRYLNLSHNEHLRYINDERINPLGLFSLKHLDLSSTKISYLDFTQLRESLETLLLRDTRITKVEFSLSTLQHLDVRGSPMGRTPTPNMFKDVMIVQSLQVNSFKMCCPQLHNERTNLTVCHYTRDLFSACTDLMRVPALRIFLWVNGFSAVLGNAAVIAYRLFFDSRILRMAYGQFALHLGFSDLTMGIYLIIIASADAAYKGEYMWKEWSWLNSGTCQAAGFLSTLSSEVSTMFIFLITLDRYLVMRYPFGQFRIIGKIISFCCALTWIIGVSIAATPLLPVFGDWTMYKSNSVCLGLPLTNEREPGWQFGVSIFIFFNFGMFALISLGQLAIYKSVRDTRMSQTQMSSVSSRRAQDQAVAKNLSLVAITNFLVWFPVGAMGMMALAGYEIDRQAYAWLAVFVVPINSAINPFLYTIPGILRKWRNFRESVTSHTKSK